MEIYLHVPYCRQKCRYCDFASFPHAESTQRAYVDAVLTEAASQAAKLPHSIMETAYLGGGTPSILPPELLTRLLEGVTAHFPLAPGAEFTSEANPGTLTHEWLDAALNCGINRLSMGMQAAQPALLKMTLRRCSRALSLRGTPDSSTSALTSCSGCPVRRSACGVRRWRRRCR